MKSLVIPKKDIRSRMKSYSGVDPWELVKGMWKDRKDDPVVWQKKIRKEWK